MKVYGYLENPTEEQVLQATQICIKGNKNRAKKNLYAIPIADGGKSLLLICWQPSPLVELNQEIFNYYFPTEEDKTKAITTFSKLANCDIQLHNGQLSEKDIVIIRELDKNPFDFFQKRMQKIEGWKSFKEGINIEQCWDMMLFALKETKPIKSNKSVFHELPAIDGSKIIFKYYQTELMFMRDDKVNQFYYLLKPSKYLTSRVGQGFTMNEAANWYRLFRCDNKFNQLIEVPLLRIELSRKHNHPIQVRCTLGIIEFHYPNTENTDEDTFHGFFDDLGEKKRFTVIPTFEIIQDDD